MLLCGLGHEVTVSNRTHINLVSLWSLLIIATLRGDFPFFVFIGGCIRIHMGVGEVGTASLSISCAKCSNHYRQGIHEASMDSDYTCKV